MRCPLPKFSFPTVHVGPEFVTLHVLCHDDEVVANCGRLTLTHDEYVAFAYAIYSSAAFDIGPEMDRTFAFIKRTGPGTHFYLRENGNCTSPD